MTYEVFEEQISAYLDGDLNAVEVVAMDRKAAECERCRTLLSDMQALKDRLARLPKEQPSSGFSFALRSHLLLEEGRENRLSQRVRRVMFGSKVRTLTSLAAALIIGLGLLGLSPEPDVLPQAAVVEDADFNFVPGQPVLQSGNHRGALERLSAQSHSLDSRLYHNAKDSALRRDTMRAPDISPWLRNQDVKRVPVSF